MDEDQESWYSTQWQCSRAGSRASRGFHFQDAVGGWLVSRMASGEFPYQRLIPEGFDDLQLESAESVQFEVKSRQGRLGQFPSRKAAQIIVDAWLRHVDRFGDCRRLTIVLEQGIEGMVDDPNHNVIELSVGQLSEGITGFDVLLAARINHHQLPTMTLESLKLNTSVVMCSWDSLTSETGQNISFVVNLPAGALRVIARTLQSEVADAIDANAEAEFANKSSLDRTSIIEKVNATAKLIDLCSIDYALAQGICSPVDSVPVEIGDAYYEGISTQLGHVNAGLVVPRPSLVSQVMAGLSVGQAVLLVGPSGIGKSAVLWSLPSALPGVLWFRLNRISNCEIPHVEQMLRAYGASPRSPVGLLVDSVKGNDLDGWPRLRQTLAAIPGALLVGTVRNEDLLPLGDIADCTTVSVSLDEQAAEAIHAGLTRRGATNVPHWREAFEKSCGLTLEFTHLLTHGSRLSEVLADQISDRVQENRSLELRILALVTTADRWSACISSGELEAALEVGAVELKAALYRLVKEHLLVENDGEVAGIHQIRSKGIVEEIHRVPPPELKSSVVSVLSTLHGADLSRFVFEVLRELPYLGGHVLRELEELARDDIGCLVSSLRGLELLDFQREVLSWVEVAERHGLPHAQLPIVFLIALAGKDSPDILPQQHQDAISDIRSLRQQDYSRDSLLASVGLDGIANSLQSTSDAEVALDSLRALAGTFLDWKPLLITLLPESTLLNALKECSLEVLSSIVSAAGDISVEFAQEVVESVGSNETLLERLRDSDPWIQEAEVKNIGGEDVGIARFLCVSQSQRDHAHGRAIRIGELLLGLLPGVNRVDVMAISPDGNTLEYNGVELGTSGLQRKYHYSTGAVARNRNWMRVAYRVFGTTETERLAEADELLTEAAKLVRDVGSAFVRRRIGESKASQLSQRLNSVVERAERLRPRMSSIPPTDDNTSEIYDPLSGLISNVCDNVLRRVSKPEEFRTLSAFIKDTVLGSDIPEVRDQPWRLLGYENAPPDLDELAAGLSDIFSVVTELLVDEDARIKIQSLARSVSTERGLARAADWSRQQVFKRAEDHRTSMGAALRSKKPNIEVFWLDGDPRRGNNPNFAIAVNLESLADWSVAVSELTPILEDHRDGSETPLLVPIVKGRSVPSLALRLISKLWPADNFGEFTQSLPPPLEQRLSTSFLAAHSSLQVYSGLSIFRNSDCLHEEVTKILKTTVSDYSEAIAAIRNFGGDACVSTLERLLEDIRGQIENEWDGEIAAGSFAAGLAKGARGDETSEMVTFSVAHMISLQWDLDPKHAITWCQALEE